MSGCVVVLVQKIGPYHHARFQEAADQGPLVAVEFRTGDAVYAWSEVELKSRYLRKRTTAASLVTTLNALAPRVVVCVGYSDPEVHLAMTWALGRGIPLVTCSDSTRIDEARVGWREAIKRSVLDGFDAALAAGIRATDYLEELGLPRDRISTAWDVIDNDYFAQGAGLARADASSNRARLGLPTRYFLCVARFVGKKNLARLIEAYAQYAAEAGPDRWSLVLSGSGPLEPELRAQIAATDLTSAICLPGFLQYPDLPACYGLAGTFVLPSTTDQWGLVVNEAMAAGLPVIVSDRCGCTPDLVESGGNGFTFDPENVAALAKFLTHMAALPEAQRAAMGKRSQEIIGSFALKTFADGLWQAVACAQRAPRSRWAWFTRIVLSVLSRLRAQA